MTYGRRVSQLDTMDFGARQTAFRLIEECLFWVGNRGSRRSVISPNQLVAIAPMSEDHSVDWYPSDTPERLIKTPTERRTVAR